MRPIRLVLMALAAQFALLGIAVPDAHAQKRSGAERQEQRAPAPPPIGGRYRVEGRNADGSTYSGVAEISGTAGGNCVIRWAIVDTPASQGFCMRQGEVFAAAYRLNNQLGLTVYRVDRGGVLDGTWSIAGQERVGRERLVPMRQTP
ncbi:hypothetical protein [Phreatobacter sp. AB_2022a]|uniref:hypothetical protein n=1 Tax=Phreatobacter sp. AB_2022a TaxID=3003134 RepID=UPI002287551F|nr:hypothetical protein [Phreatobacter sp. AB_2022a]MCZ0735831.1 hypothetical protein [Phreatobacter sp. AB_2022a]